MKKKKAVLLFIAISLIGIISMIIIITRIREKNTVKDADMGNVDIGDINTGDIDVGDINVGNIEVEHNEKKIEETISNKFVFEDIEGIKKIIVQNKVGNISVSTSKDNHITVKTESIITAYNKKNLEKIKKNIDIQKSVNNEECILNIVSKENEKDLWEWLDGNIDKYNVSIQINISIPEGLNAFAFDTECGEINVTGLNGNMYIKNRVGSITVNQCQLEEKCGVETKTGNVELSLCENLDYNSSIDILTRTGNIKINVAKNLIKNTKKEENMIETLVGQKYAITANTTTGVVNIIE